MRADFIFGEWAEDLPHGRKAQLARELLLFRGEDNLSSVEQEKLEDAGRHLLAEE